MFDIVSYLLGKKSAGGGGLPPSITKLESGEFTAVNEGNHTIVHSMGSVKHSIFLIRKGMDINTALIQARLYDPGTDQTTHYNVTATTVATGERIHQVPGMDICEPPSGAKYNGTYRYILWY